MRQLATIHITTSRVMLNEQPVNVGSAEGKQMLTSLYKQHVGDYPKFYKMDPLSQLGFIASELLIRSLREPVSEEREDRAIVLVNRSASLAADARYEETIQTGENYFPSPADFVYTLPNIVTGEIAIRHHYHGETTFLVVEQEAEETLKMLLQQAFLDEMTQSVLGGWLECSDPDHFEAKLGIWSKE